MKPVKLNGDYYFKFDWMVEDISTPKYQNIGCKEDDLNTFRKALEKYKVNTTRNNLDECIQLFKVLLQGCFEIKGEKNILRDYLVESRKYLEKQARKFDFLTDKNFSETYTSVEGISLRRIFYGCFFSVCSFKAKRIPKEKEEKEGRRLLSIGEERKSNRQ